MKTHHAYYPVYTTESGIIYVGRFRILRFFPCSFTRALRQAHKQANQSGWKFERFTGQPRPYQTF